MPYLLDANVLIGAFKDYYRFNICPGFWDWIVNAHAAGSVYSIVRVRDELKDRGDALSVWALAQPSRFFIPVDSGALTSAVEVTNWTNRQGFKSHAVATFFGSADYWLVAHGLATGWKVATHETPDPASKKRVKIPDACRGVGASYINPFQMLDDEGARFTL